MSCEQNAGENDKIKIKIKPLKYFKLRYLGATLTSETYIHEQTKSKVNLLNT
jgi:hypothetical protein